MRHQPALDGIRTVAVFGVIASHLGLPLARGAGVGVELFFVLSGFLITTILMSEEERFGSVDLPRFYIRRLMRLYPALLAVAAFSLIAAYSLRSSSGDDVYAVLISVTYLMNFNRAFDWGPEGLLPHTWSLAMEEQFYLVWPLLLMLAPKRFRLSLTTALIAGVCLWRIYLLHGGATVDRVYNGFDTHSDGLLIGCALGLLFSRLPEAVFQTATKWAWAPFVVLLLVFAFTWTGTRMGQAFGNPLVELLAAWLIISLQRPSGLQRMLSSRPFTYLGRRSYGIYLWHIPIILLAPTLPLPTLTVFVLVATVALSALSYRFVEDPFLRWKDRLARNGIGPSLVASEAAQTRTFSVDHDRAPTS